MKLTLSMRWRRAFSMPRMTRWSVAAVFTLGSVTGMGLLHCASERQPAETALACQAIAWLAWAAQHPEAFSRPVTEEAAIELFQALHRCPSALPQDPIEIVTSDPFGVGGEPSASEPDAGVLFRSRP